MREKGVNPALYLIVRVLLQPFFHIYLRMSRIGREHIPAEGPVIIAANHRSFFDPFAIATMAPRPMYYMAKRELFEFHPWLAWLLTGLGAFPVDRGNGDADTIETAKTILSRGDIVLVFPEGTRTRPGALGKPKRGVGRLALETGVPVVPVAIIGTEDIRNGWRIRPRKMRIRAGRPLRFPTVTDPSPALAGAVTDRIWPRVMLQWEWLGGLPPIRRAAIIGAGAWGTAMAVSLARAGYEVELGCRTPEQAAALAEARVNDAYLPGVELPSGVRVASASDLDLSTDLVCLATPARSLPAVLAAHGDRISRDAGLLVLSKGLVPPLGTLPSAFASEHSSARAVAILGGPARPSGILERSGSVVVASLDRGFARQLADALGAAGLHLSRTTDVTGVELAGCARNAAVLAAAAASLAGPKVAGAAAEEVYAEVDALARARGGQPEKFAGFAAAGGLLAALAADTSGSRRAGELLAQGVPAGEISRGLGQRADEIDSVPLLAIAAHTAHVDAPALDALAALLDGRIDAHEWTATVTKTARPRRSPPPIRA